MKRPLRHALALASVMLFAGCATSGREQPAPVPELKPGRLIGYLPIKERVDSGSILPPPPLTQAETATDVAISQAALGLKGSQRWTLAIRDADVNFPEAAGVFSCALGTPITQKGHSISLPITAARGQRRRLCRRQRQGVIQA